MKKKILYQQPEEAESSKKSIPAKLSKKSKIRAITSLGTRFMQRWFPDTKRGKV